MKYNSGQFKEGNVPWNKGREGLQAAWNRGTHINTNPKKGIYKECLYCHTSFYVPQCRKDIARFCSIECQHKGYLRPSGENHHNWKGGVVQDDLKRLLTYKWRKIAKSVYMRDKYLCQICFTKCGGSYDKHRPRIQCHHIDSNKENNSISNLITVCISCHAKITFGITKPDLTIKDAAGNLRKVMTCA